MFHLVDNDTTKHNSNKMAKKAPLYIVVYSTMSSRNSGFLRVFERRRVNSSLF